MNRLLAATRTLIRPILACALASLVSAAHADAFGLAAGMSLEQVETLTGPLKKHRNDHYSAFKVPNPLPAFESYHLRIDPRAGLCELIAVGITIDDDGDGGKVRGEFEQTQKKLHLLFGPAEVVDRVEARSGFIGLKYSFATPGCRRGAGSSD